MEFSNTSIDMRDLKPFMDVSHFLMMNETQFFKILMEFKLCFWEWGFSKKKKKERERMIERQLVRIDLWGWQGLNYDYVLRRLGIMRPFATYQPNPASDGHRKRLVI